MADSKISGLSAQTTIAADDMFVLETAASATKKITGANLKAAQTDATITTTDVTTNDASTSKHGFMPKLVNDAGKVFTGTGTQVYPPGYEFNYVERTTDATSTATSAATATTILTSGSVTYDGSTAIIISFSAVQAGNSAATATIFNLWEDSTDLTRYYQFNNNTDLHGIFVQHRRTPSAGAHVYTIRMWVGSGTGTVYAVAGTYLPAFIRIVKA